MMEEIRGALDKGEFASYKKSKLDGMAAGEDWQMTKNGKGLVFRMLIVYYIY